MPGTIWKSHFCPLMIGLGRRTGRWTSLTFDWVKFFKELEAGPDFSFTSAVLNNSEFVAPLLWVDGTLPRGLWREHEIIFSSHILPEGCLSFRTTHIKSAQYTMWNKPQMWGWHHWPAGQGRLKTICSCASYWVVCCEGITPHTMTLKHMTKMVPRSCAFINIRIGGGDEPMWAVPRACLLQEQDWQLSKHR